MNPITKPNVSLTLRTLEAGDHVAFLLSDVSETNVRSVCSRLTQASDRLFTIERCYPELKVTRTR